MPNFKKFVALSLGAVCLMTSCNHTVNADSAKKFIENNYGDKVTPKELNSIAVNYTTKLSSNKSTECTNLAKKESQAFAKSCNFTLSEDKYSFNIESLDKSSTLWKNTHESMLYKITTIHIDFFEAFKTSDYASNVIYTTSGNELSIYAKFKEADYGNFKKNSEALYIFNKCGQNRYRRSIESYTANDKSTVTITTIYMGSYKV